MRNENKMCPVCNGGSGKIFTSPDELSAKVMRRLYDGGWLDRLTFRDKVDMTRELERDGETTCPRCDGSGEK